MALLEAEGGGRVGAVAFPDVLLGPQGRTSYYVSALTGQGDEFFTELQTALGDRPPRR
jgi:hypothetical protein